MFEKKVTVGVDKNGKYLPEDIERAIKVRRAVDRVDFPEGPAGAAVLHFKLFSKRVPKDFNWIEALAKLSL